MCLRHKARSSPLREKICSHPKRWCREGQDGPSPRPVSGPLSGRLEEKRRCFRRSAPFFRVSPPFCLRPAPVLSPPGFRSGVFFVLRSRPGLFLRSGDIFRGRRSAYSSGPGKLSSPGKPHLRQAFRPPRPFRRPSGPCFPAPALPAPSVFRRPRGSPAVFPACFPYRLPFAALFRSCVCSHPSAPFPGGLFSWQRSVQGQRSSLQVDLKPAVFYAEARICPSPGLVSCPEGASGIAREAGKAFPLCGAQVSGIFRSGVFPPLPEGREPANQGVFP